MDYRTVNLNIIVWYFVFVESVMFSRIKRRKKKKKKQVLPALLVVVKFFINGTNDRSRWENSSSMIRGVTFAEDLLNDHAKFTELHQVGWGRNENLSILFVNYDTWRSYRRYCERCRALSLHLKVNVIIRERYNQIYEQGNYVW